MKKHVFYILMVAVAFGPRVAHADDEKVAAEHFRQGQRAFDARDFARAASEFEAANRSKPAAAALLSAGIAWQYGGDALDAALDLAAALDAGGLDPRDEATARQHLAEVDAKLGQIDVAGVMGTRATVDGKNERMLPFHARVSPGAHIIDARTPNDVATHEIAHVAAGETVHVDMTPHPVAPPPPPPTPSSLQRTLGWVAVGAGVAAFGVGVAVGATGLGARDQFVNGGSVDASLRDEAVAMRTATNVLWIGAGIFAVGGVALVLTAPHAKAVTIGVHPRGATLRWEF